MKFKSWTAGIAALTLAAAPTFAADSLEQWSYDQQVTPVGCCDSGYDCGTGCDCGSACGGGGLLSGMGGGLVEGFSLSSALGFDALDIGGWTQLGYHDEATLLTNRPAAAGGPGASFNNVPNNVNLHQQYFYVGKQADGSKGFDIGFRADFVFGIDGPDTQSFGNPAGSFDNGGDFTRGDGQHGWAIPQLYGEVAMGDLSIIMGHFYTLVGYEVVTAPDNFFYSHAYTQYNSEPFTHTGVLATYTGFENMTLYGGWTSGWDSGFDSVNGGSSLIGGFSVGLGDSITMTYINTYGNFGAISTPGDDENYGHSIVFDVALNDRIQYVFQTDYKQIDSTGDEDLGINQYLFYRWNDIVSLGTRVEWWRDNGVSHAGYTSGVNIKLLDNLVMRPEYRKDTIPGLSLDNDIFGCDMILTY